MGKRKKNEIDDKSKNQKNSNNFSSTEFKEDLISKEEELNKNNKEIDIDNQKTIKEENTDEYKKILKESSDLREEKLRLLAEMENLRKRFEKERLDLIKFGNINLAREILLLGDNLERALVAIPKDEKYPQSINNLVEGLKIVQKEFSSVLEKNGVKKIDSLNKKFDHNYHQAIMEIEKEDVEDGTIVQEIQTGYTMHDKLLRPAMVGVAKKITTEKSKKNIDKEENKDKIKS